MQAANLKTNPQLTHAELVANVNILLSTGHETTTNLIGNGLLALIQNPDQIELLRSNPALIPNSVEEMLRYDNPVQITYRSAIADVEIGDKCIHAGDLVNTILGSANRDPARFTNPDRFDVLRNEGRHLGFGLGIHFCLGAPLRLKRNRIPSILHRFRHIRP
jgi:cytochrome P450